MPRRLRQALACVLLVICAAALAARWRSDDHRDVFYWSAVDTTCYGVVTAPGEIVLFSHHHERRDRNTLLEPTGFHQIHYPYGEGRFQPDSNYPRTPQERYIVPRHGDLGPTTWSGPVPEPRPAILTRWELPGLRRQGGTFRGVRYEQIVVSYWLLIAVSAALGLLWAARRLRARRTHHRPGVCPSCGYDLRATPDRCPECGATPHPATTA